MIERLASTDAAVRAKAETETENRGKALLPDLRRNRTNADPAVAHAARLWATALALPAHRRDDPRATIVTDQGTIVLELFEDSAPNTVGNFVYLADKKFFDHGVFHRVEDWVVQGGDPKGDGTGGPGYQFSNEVNWDSLGLNERKQAQLRRQGFESTPGLKSLPNVIGAVAMAHAGPGTDGSQFYILRKGAPWLNGAYTVFAQVIDGMEVVDQFENGSRPKIVSIRIENERPHKYVDGAHGPSKEPR